MNIRIIFIFAVLSLVSSCKDDEPQKLALHAPQQVDNAIVLNWEQANISGFKYYMVMRSSDQRQYKVINDIVTPASDAFYKEITTFEDRTYPLGVDTLYYKIMAIGDETLSSQNLCYRVEHPTMLLKGNFLDLYHIEGTNKISVFSYRNSEGYRLKVLDLETGQFLSDGVPAYGDRCFWGKYDEKTEFYSSASTLSVYNASTLQQVASLQNPSYGLDDLFVCNGKGIIYIYGYYYLYLLNRETGIYTEYEPVNYFESRRLYYNSKDNKLYVVDYYGNKIRTFNLDNQGNVTGEETYTIPTANYYSEQPLYIENTSLFIVSTDSGIKVLDINTKTLHDTDFTQIPWLALLHNNVFYVYVEDYSWLVAVGDTPKIYCFSAEDFRLIKSIPIRVEPRSFTADNEYLYFIGQYEYDTYILDKIKF